MELDIGTHDSGFYDGFSRAVTIPSKVIVSLLIMWANLFSRPVNASKTLGAANSTDHRDLRRLVCLFSSRA